MATLNPKPRDPAADAEPWEYLARHRDRTQAFISSLQAIMSACPKDPGHVRTPVADCKGCHRKMVDLVSRRFLASPETEWYADRRTFLQHLAELFPAVKRGEVEASGIEDRVMDEKRRWFREHVRKMALAFGGGGFVGVKEELLALMDDQKLKFPDFCEQVKGVISRASKTGLPDGSLQKLEAAGSDPNAKVQAYKEVFFPDGEGSEMRESTRNYLEMMEQGVSITKLAAKVLDDRRQGIADQAQLARLQDRIEYLKKAKATWLLQKKRGEGEAEKAKLRPSCFNCRRPAGTDNPASCSICHVAVGYGIREEPVVYCSEDCQRLGHERHVAQEHRCAAGERCITLHPPGEDQGSSETSSDISDVYICKECLKHRKRVVAFCTLACGVANFNRHRGEAHPSFGSGRVYDDYHPRTHLVTVQRALRELQEKQVIDELEFVREHPPAVDPPKPQFTEASELHKDVNRRDNVPSNIRPHAETSSSDHMDLDGVNEERFDAAPASPRRAPPLRHDDEGSAEDNMTDVEAQHPPEGPAHNRNPPSTDTEMIDAVDPSEFADQPRAPRRVPAPADHRAPENPPPAQQGPSEPTMPSPAARPEQAPSSATPNNAAGNPVGPAAVYPRHSNAGPSTNPSEHIPLDSPHAAAAVSQPSRTITSPDRITSIEPMPSLGRSLEIEIAKIPAGAEAAYSSDTGMDGPSRGDDAREVASERSQALDNMDHIADGKMEHIGETVGRMGRNCEREEEREGGEEGRRRQHDSLMTGDRDTAQPGKVTREGETGGEARKDAEAAKPSGSADPANHPSAQEDTAQAMRLAEHVERFKAATPGTESEAGKVPGTDELNVEPSQRSADSREEGEISDDSAKKRKSDSVEPGEVEEEDRPERKKAKSEEAADGQPSQG